MTIRLLTPVTVRGSTTHQTYLRSIGKGIFHLRHPDFIMPLGFLKVACKAESMWIKNMLTLQPGSKNVGRALHEGAYRVSTLVALNRLSLVSKPDVYEFHLKCGYIPWPIQPEGGAICMTLSAEKRAEWEWRVLDLGSTTS